MTQWSSEERDALIGSLASFRRAMMRDGFLGAVAATTALDLSLPQMAVLFLLDKEGGTTAGEVARLTGRSPSATSRFLDQLVKLGLVERTEDPEDRRQKRITIANPGRELVHTIEAGRAEAQLTLMEQLSLDERRQVMAAMQLLAEAARRRTDHGRNDLG
ncbi:MAG: MarR family transcriptional regulator [Cyanobacteria bacterium RYN_339]|nr:MarR family transcriptional regulator [Cyanobacteria bacterium RYN_339]